MKILCEMDKSPEIFFEESQDNKDLFLKGTTLVADVKNANKRIYPKSVLSEAIDKHKKEFLDSGGAVGELNHPTENISQINFNNVSHKFVEVIEEGNVFVTKAKVLNTISGKQVKNLHEGEVRLGISSRAFGDTKISNGVSIVESLYIVSFGDIVANPSAPGAFVSAVMENKEWLWENGELVEKDIEPVLEGYKKIISNSSKHQRKLLFTQLFEDYLKQIKFKSK